MKITSITRQAKRPDRYSVFVDGEYSFSLNADQLLRTGLAAGQDIDKQQMRDLKTESEEGKLYDKILNLLSYRPRSRWEIESYMTRKKYTPALTMRILNRLSDYGYLDDEKFARRWVESRRLLKPISSRKLRQELKQKRVANAVIDKVLEEDDTDELAVLKALVERKKSKYADKQKLMAYLARQGFNYGDIKEVLNGD